MDKTYCGTPKKYDFGVLDPCWQYDNLQGNDPKRGGITYPTLTMEELYNIPVGNAFNDNAIIVVWCTWPKICDQYYEKYDPMSIIRNWNFRPVTALLVWVKTNKNGKVIDVDWDSLDDYDDFYSGLGRYSNSNTEFAIVARKGKMLPRYDTTVKQLMIEPIGKHSAKPQEQYNRYERLFKVSGLDCIELFARRDNPPPEHYDATGLDFDGVDIRDWIKGYV